MINRLLLGMDEGSPGSGLSLGISIHNYCSNNGTICMIWKLMIFFM